MFSLMSRIFIDGRKNVGTCEDSPPTGENNSSELFRSVFIIKTFVRKFFSFGFRHKKDKNLLNFFFFLLGFVRENCLYFILLGKKSLCFTKKTVFPSVKTFF